MHSLLRLAGWSALGAGLVHLTQFLALGIGPLFPEPEFPTPAESTANYSFGLVGGLTFTLIGLSYLLFFSAATEIVWRGTTGTAVVWRRAMQSAAVIGITGWFLAGMINPARRGFNAAGIGAAASDDSIARAALQSTYVSLTAATIMSAVLFCAWWISFAVRALSTHIIGWPSAVAVVLLGGIAPLAGLVANVGAVPSIIVAFFVIGPVLLIKDRRLRAAETTPAVVAH